MERIQRGGGAEAEIVDGTFWSTEGSGEDGGIEYGFRWGDGELRRAKFNLH